MPTNIGVSGAPFNAEIPRIDENADIQIALRTYHYGEGSSGEEIAENSIAGFLQALTDNKIDVNAEIIPLNADLNNYIQPGFYIQDSNAKARSAGSANYPKVPKDIGLAYAGLLRVMRDDTNIYQQYQVGGLDQGKTYTRSFFGNLGWSDWITFAEEDHEHQQYFEIEAARAEFEPQIKLLTIRQPTINNNTYTLSSLDANALVMIDNLSLPNTVLVPTNSQVNLATGTQITILQKNIGQTTITGNTGVTVHFTPGNRLRAQWSSASLIKIATNEWVLVGDLA